MKHGVKVLWWTVLFFPVEIILPLYQVTAFGLLYAFKIPQLSKTPTLTFHASVNRLIKKKTPSLLKIIAGSKKYTLNFIE